MPRRKYLGRYDSPIIKSITTKLARTDAIGIAGHAALVRLDEVTQPYMVGEKGAEICIGDNDYAELRLLPDGKNWMLTAIYDNNDKLVEWYFDITRENGVDENGEPYCDDLYLDIVMTPDNRILILDEDELAAALEYGNITQQEYDMAHSVARQLADDKILTAEYLGKLCTNILTLFA